jgi:hypothetical protein
MSSSTPRLAIPSRAARMSFFSAPMLFTSLAGKPLYIVSSTNTWQSASMCEVAMPWNAMPMKSSEVSRPAPSVVHASPATTMWCSAGIGFSTDGATGKSSEQETVTPSRTVRAARARRSGVM